VKDLQAIEIRGQETRKERMSHDFIPTSVVVGVVLMLCVVMMILNTRRIVTQRK